VTLYVDASALLKLYVEERDSPRARELLVDPREWTTGRHTVVEVRRNLARLLSGRDLVRYRGWFDGHWQSLLVVELTRAVCAKAADLAEQTGTRTSDALHLGAALEAGEGHLPMVTFDRRLAEAARSLGWTVLGA
jgi:predicted nucleic acid-binding protein